MKIERLLRFGCVLVLLPLIGCSLSDEKITNFFIKVMDAKPPERRVPNWEHTKAMMLRETLKVGEEAPDFVLETCDGTDRFRLSQYKGDRPVVLIFGSWT